MDNKNVKKRNWAFVLYPESAPEDWLLQLQQTGLQCAISPLHDKDLDPTGEPKKPHYHVILVYGSPTTYRNVRALTNGKLGQTVPQPLEQVRGYYRYLTHLDNPEKYQYSATEIVTLNGFNIQDFCELTKSEVNKILRELMDYIQENRLDEYADLMEMTMCEGVPPEWFDVASSHTLFLGTYLKSRRFRAERQQQRQ